EEHLGTNSLQPVNFAYMFKRPWANRLYLELSRHRLAWNAAAPLSPLVALSDRRHDGAHGSIVLVHALRHPSQEPSVSR
ncbi:MAG TPA: hypothetical protein VE174_00730, partial [Actinomycetota bacterium]|nr:hypothetical protein [Actinomycetota bacterium]